MTPIFPKLQKIAHNALLHSAIPLSFFLAASAHSADTAELTFGYIPAAIAHPFNVATIKGFENAAKAADVKVVVIDPRGSVERQGNAIDDLLVQGVDAIGFLPLDSVVAESFVDKIADHEIPVAAIAVMVGDSRKRAIDAPYEKLTALVTTDEIKAGEVAGTYAATLLPKDRAARIAIIEGAAGYSVVEQRTSGFMSGLNKAGIKFEVVASQPTNWTPEQGEQTCQNILTAHPDVDLIYSHADDMAIGCARAISALGSQADIVAAGGGSKIGADAIAADEIKASVCNRPQLLGELMFKALYAAVKDPSTQKAQYITYDMPMLTKQTLDLCPDKW